MKLEEHCEAATRIFGNPHEEIHRWLDEYWGNGLGVRHRREQHHEAGSKQAVVLFGEDAGEVAHQHIIFGLKEAGWTEQDPFPEDEANYMRMGLF